MPNPSERITDGRRVPNSNKTTMPRMTISNGPGAHASKYKQDSDIEASAIAASGAGENSLNIHATTRPQTPAN